MNLCNHNCDSLWQHLHLCLTREGAVTKIMSWRRFASRRSLLGCWPGLASELVLFVPACQHRRPT